MIQGWGIVYYGPEPWAGMWRNRHQLLSRLARANTVVYVEPRPHLRPVVRALLRGTLSAAGFLQGGLTPVQEGLWTYRTPAYAGIGGGPLGRPITRWLRVRHQRRALEGLDIRPERLIVWLSHPGQADARDDLPARLRLYHVVDEYLGYPGVDSSRRARLAAWEDRILDWADLVVAVTPELVAARERGRAAVRLLPNAADLAAFERALANPADPGMPRPVIGYAGLISARLDLAAVTQVAISRPDWSFVLVGDIVTDGCEGELAQLRGLPNVWLTGPRPAGEIPALVAGWDVGLIPYRVNAETQHASPLKLYEYLAAGLPVVAADIPAVRRFAGQVEIASGPADLAAAIARSLATDSPQARAARRAAMQPHSWEARVEALSGMIEEMLRIN